MKAYIIVDITITDPALYEDYKKLTPARLYRMKAGLLYAVVPRKRWRVTGNRGDLLYSNFHPQKKQERGGHPTPTLLLKPCGRQPLAHSLLWPRAVYSIY
jgi:hypothetical protein